MTDYSDLIERVGKAEGPDREIDAELWDRLVGSATWPNYANQPAFTGDLNAALSLVDRMLPGWDICISRVRDLEADAPPAPWVVSMGPPQTFQAAQGEKAPTHALAVIAALLRALEEKGKA